MFIVTAIEGTQVQIEYPNGLSDLVGKEPREVPEGCDAFARQAIRETGRIKETKKHPPKGASMLEGLTMTESGPVEAEHDEKKPKRTSKK